MVPGDKVGRIRETTVPSGIFFVEVRQMKPFPPFDRKEANMKSSCPRCPISVWAGSFGGYLTVKIHFNSVVYGKYFIILGDNKRIIGVMNRVTGANRIQVEKIIKFISSHSKCIYHLSFINLLALAGYHPGIVHIHKGVPR